MQLFLSLFSFLIVCNCLNAHEIYNAIGVESNQDRPAKVEETLPISKLPIANVINLSPEEFANKLNLPNDIKDVLSMEKSLASYDTSSLSKPEIVNYQELHKIIKAYLYNKRKTTITCNCVDRASKSPYDNPPSFWKQMENLKNNNFIITPSVQFDNHSFPSSCFNKDTCTSTLEYLPNSIISLKIMYLYRHPITDKNFNYIIAKIGMLPNLKELEIAHFTSIQFTNDMSVFQSNYSIEKIILNDINNINEQSLEYLMQYFSSMRNLNTFVIDKGKENFCPPIRPLTSLTTLIINSSRVTKNYINYTSFMSHIKNLFLHNLEITGGIFPQEAIDDFLINWLKNPLSSLAIVDLHYYQNSYKIPYYIDTSLYQQEALIRAVNSNHTIELLYLDLLNFENQPNNFISSIKNHPSLKTLIAKIHFYKRDQRPNVISAEIFSQIISLLENNISIKQLSLIYSEDVITYKPNWDDLTINLLEGIKEKILQSNLNILQLAKANCKKISQIPINNDMQYYIEIAKSSGNLLFYNNPQDLESFENIQKNLNEYNMTLFD